MLVLYFGAMLFIVSRDTIFTPIWMAVSVGVLMALAIATKLYPLIAMPVVSAWFGARYSWRIAGVYVGVALLFTAGSFIPFLAMGERDFFSGLTAFGNTWLRNESVFGIIQSAATFAFGSDTVAIAKIPGASGPLGMVVAKLVAAIALLAVCAGCTWNVLRTAREQPAALVISRNLALLFLAWFLLLPMAFPWYLLGALPFLACARMGAIPWVLIGCAAVFYYGEFYIDGHDLPKSYSTRLLQIEYGIPLAFALCVWASRALSNRVALMRVGK